MSKETASDEKEKITTMDLRKAVSAGVADMSRNAEPPEPEFSYGDIHALHNETGKAIRLSIMHLTQYLNTLGASEMEESDTKRLAEISAELADKTDEFVIRYNDNCAKHSDKKAEEMIVAEDVIRATEVLQEYHTLSMDVAAYYSEAAEELEAMGIRNKKDSKEETTEEKDNE